MLGAGRPQHLCTLAVEHDDRAYVHAELQVDELRLMRIRGAADPDACVVDQDVEPAEAFTVALDDVLDGVLVGHVRRHRFDLPPLVTERCGRLFERVRLPRADRERVALLAQRFGDGTPDSTGRSSHEGGTVSNVVSSSTIYREQQASARLDRWPCARARAPSRLPLGFLVET